MSELSDDYLFVVAIDFGTTYSGYAFSSRDDFKTDPLKISSNQAWNAGSKRLLSLKTPTCLLLDDDEKFVSFGYEAEDKYSDIVLNRQQNEYLFFQRFKMQLYKDKQIKANMMIEDVTGKPVSAMKVFAKSIKALKKHFFDSLKQRGVEIKPDEIRWVLTVPAIWTDAAKQFMRKSAGMAGIADNQLLIALEPEAASIYCQYLPTEKLQGAGKGFMMSNVGTQYMVVDNGGGTVDITIHEKMSNGTLKEVCRASGGDCGGTSVDMGFYQLVVKLIGAPLINTIKKEEPSGYLDIFREFEAAKRTVDPAKKDKVTMTFPIAMLNEMCEEHLGENFASIVKQSPFKDQIEIKYDKLRVDAELMQNLFNDAAEKIVSLMRNVYKRRVDHIVLVGGFSECKIIQNEIKASFPNSRVIVPEDAGVAVAKGAVLFGHRPDYIICRVSRYTYGVRYEPAFDPQKHEPGRKVLNSIGDEICRGVFDSFLKIGEEIKLGTRLIKHFGSKPFSTSTKFSIFKSKIENPMYTDKDDCELIGSVEINYPKSPKKGRDLRVEMIFGNTELSVAAYDVQSGEKCEASFELI